MNPPNSYHYEVNLEWRGERKGMLSAEDFPQLAIAPPPEFSGPPSTWTPEHLLVAATASCLMTTFLAIAELSKLSVLSYHIKGQGRLEKVPGEGYRFTEIILAPEISVAPNEVDRAARLLEKAEKNCLISKSLRAVVTLEPRFATEATEIAP